MTRVSEPRWQEVQRALISIGTHTPEWTNHSDSDPGLTVLELLAFVAEEVGGRGSVLTERDRAAIGRLEAALADLAPRPAVEVRVDGEAWTAVDDLATSGPDDRHYELDRKTGGIAFGDGTRGRLPRRGARVRAAYRYGDGETRAVTVSTPWPPRNWDAEIGLRTCGTLRVTPDPSGT